ncbi:hypothetical protein [Streptomyces tendae]|uniref:hypothetical protein n=1 Tax=Streptomyces tendae TaxID=1932 RepID=UPI003D710BEB
MPLLLTGSTVVDGVRDKGVEGRSILVGNGRIVALGRPDDLPVPTVENAGRHLMRLTPEAVGEEVRKYIEHGTDFVQYASNEHGGSSAGAFIQLSERTQRVIVAAVSSSPGRWSSSPTTEAFSLQRSCGSRAARAV